MRHQLEIVWRKRKDRKGKPVAYIVGPGVGRHGESLGTSDREEAATRFRQRREQIERAAEDTSRPDDQPIRALVDYYSADDDNKDLRFLDRIITTSQTGPDGSVVMFGNLRVSELTSDLVRDWAKMAYSKAKPQTLNRQFLTPLMAVINYNAGRKRCNRLVVTRFEPAKQARKEAVTMEWVKAFANAAKAHGYMGLAAMETFMATSGARRGSCLRLLPEDLDLDARKALLRDTKTGDDVEAQLSREAVAVLRAVQMTPRHPVFGYPLDRHGVPPKSFYRDWKAVCRLAGIAYIPPHQSGRHTFATHMIVTKGKDPWTVAKLAGWKGTRMLDKYVQARADLSVVDDSFTELDGQIVDPQRQISAPEPPTPPKILKDNT